jgi:AP-3 complex subunit sigma
LSKVIIFNNSGKPRLTKFYGTHVAPHARLEMVERIYGLVRNRPESVCNFVDVPEGDVLPINGKGKGKSEQQGDKLRVIYRVWDSTPRRLDALFADLR